MSDSNDPMEAVHQYVDAFNNGDEKAMCASPAFPETSGPGLILQAWRKEVCSGSDEEVSGRAA